MTEKRLFNALMPSIDHAERDNDTIVDAQADDEEAQLLPSEELDFEDNSVASLPYPTRQRSFWQRLHGPEPLQLQTIRPWFPSIQQAPVRFLEKKLPRRKHRIIVLEVVLGLWLVVFLFSLRSQLPIDDGVGGKVVNLDCVDTFWRRKNECGLDGIDCQPFSNDSFAFRCPANCASVRVLNPRAVGPLDVNYRPLVIGDGIYRGDSFICGSAIHAGIITDAEGGCGRVTRLADHDTYATANRHGIESIPFDSYFPLSFQTTREDSKFACPSDPRQSLLIISLLFTTILSVFSTSSLQFFPIFTLIFAHVVFVSDPPSASYRNFTVLPDHISAFARRLLPAFFVAVILYQTIVKRTLSGLQAPIEKTVLWLGGFWFGALSNYTFDWIPISRLNAHDLEQQPGAKLALAIILLVLVCIIAGQVYFFWLEGRMLRYLTLYGCFILSILICLGIPGVSLRLHHYIIALLLLPGTGMQTRPSLLYQGILLGLFVNGIARWDFDSVLQTAADLRGDATLDSVVPALLQPLILQEATNLSVKFSWAKPPFGMHGISALVNDVERGRAFFTDDTVSEFTWTREDHLELPEYFRFAFIRDGRTLDYTRAGTLFPNGTWAMNQDG
jgi:hypothetical protein